MSVIRMAPSHVNGGRVGAYPSSWDAENWICVTTAYTGMGDEVQNPNGFTVMEVTRREGVTVLRRNLDADTAHGFARLRAESTLDGKPLAA